MTKKQSHTKFGVLAPWGGDDRTGGAYIEGSLLNPKDEQRLKKIVQEIIEEAEVGGGYDICGRDIELLAGFLKKIVSEE